MCLSMLVWRQASKIVQGKGKLLTGVDSKLGGGIQAEMSFFLGQFPNRTPGANKWFGRMLGTILKGLSEGGLQVRS